MNLNGSLCNCSNTNSSLVHEITDFISPPPRTGTSLRHCLSKLILYLQSDFCWLPVVWLTTVRPHPVHSLIFWVWKLVMVWKSLRGNSSEKVQFIKQWSREAVGAGWSQSSREHHCRPWESIKLFASCWLEESSHDALEGANGGHWGWLAFVRKLTICSLFYLIALQKYAYTHTRATF